MAYFMGNEKQSMYKTCNALRVFFINIRFSILYKEPTRCNFGSIDYQSLQDYSTCFGRFLRPSSRALKTVVATSAVATDLGHPYWIYIIPNHGMHQ